MVELKKKKNRITPELLNVGVYLITPLLLGVFLGLELDKRFDSKPVFVIVGILLGTVSAFYNMWKVMKEVNE